VRRHAVVAVVHFAHVQCQLLPHPGRQDAVAQRAAEACSEEFTLLLKALEALARP